MDRFYYCPLAPLYPGEFQVSRVEGVKLYDGEAKTRFENGDLILTSHRIVWFNPSIDSKSLSLLLQLVVITEDEQGGFMKSEKISMHLTARPEGMDAGPVDRSSASHVKLSFKQGGAKSFHEKLRDVLQKRQWEVRIAPSASAASRGKTGQQPRVMRSGIQGIEKSMAQRAKLTDTQISKAFQDLDKLMEMAKPMVSLAKNISTKIRDRQGDVTEDETVKFKSYLLSLGISDPVTKESHGSGQIYFKELAKEMFRILETPLQESGGMMTMTDAFCRVNRARGLELVSPEDLLNACSFFKNEGCISAEELAKVLGISVVLSKERLLAAENAGFACRDDTLEALKFYPNRFLTET